MRLVEVVNDISSEEVNISPSAANASTAISKVASTAVYPSSSAQMTSTVTTDSNSSIMPISAKVNPTLHVQPVNKSTSIGLISAYRFSRLGAPSSIQKPMNVGIAAVYNTTRASTNGIFTSNNGTLDSSNGNRPIMRITGTAGVSSPSNYSQSCSASSGQGQFNSTILRSPALSRETASLSLRNSSNAGEYSLQFSIRLTRTTVLSYSFIVERFFCMGNFFF